MILIISTCSDRLSEKEFVRPICDIVKKDFVVRHYNDINEMDLKRFNNIIICGTALIDNEYLKHLDKFCFLKETNSPVLGICSGMQIIGLLFGTRLSKKKEIGMLSIKTKPNKLFSGELDVYELHGNSLAELNNFDILAKSKNSVQAIKHKSKEIYGIMFHPEVRNKWIVERFLEV